MPDRARQVIVHLIAVATVLAIAAAPTVALAAEGDADTVDGRDAVKFTNNRNERAGKLVAANHRGYLPSNIVKPYWGNIKNMPSGFADGVDDKGVVKLQVRIVESVPRPLAPGATGSVTAECDPGWYVIAGGFEGPRVLSVFQSFPAGARSWQVAAENTAGSLDADVSAYAVCLIARPKDLISE
jgi:hypothetical protein